MSASTTNRRSIHVDRSSMTLRTLVGNVGVLRPNGEGAASPHLNPLGKVVRDV